ncbi:MAG: carbonic anhydrase [Bacteroidota bacterium]
MSKLDNLLKQNSEWADQFAQEHPDFFSEQVKGQSPDYLWIGCSDSRVPVNQSLNLNPGDVFVHRNVANQVITDDLNAQSVIEYAVNALQVPHILVSGHYGCGGVKAALDNLQDGLTAQWIQPIRQLYMQYQEILDALDEDARWAKLVELNVLKQVEQLASLPVVQKAWASGQDLNIHGLAYKLSDGKIKNLDCHVSSAQEAADTIRAARERCLQG